MKVKVKAGFELWIGEKVHKEGQEFECSDEKAAELETYLEGAKEASVEE